MLNFQKIKPFKGKNFLWKIIHEQKLFLKTKQFY